MVLGHRDQLRGRFHVPGHKGGTGRYHDFARLLGQATLASDLTELPNLDDPHWPRPGGAFAAASALAAEAFGASSARLLAGGSTAGVLAMILGCLGPRQTLLAPHPFHRSVVSGVLLAGCRLQTLGAAAGSGGIPEPAEATAVARAIFEFRPNAVLVTSPTYQGLVQDIASLAAACGRAGIPLLVDAAHGAHFGFAPDFPPSPVAAGASAAVISLHKTAGALTPGALLLAGPCPGLAAPVDLNRLHGALRLVESSSPSFPVLASVDLARRSLVVDGRRDWSRVAQTCGRTREAVARETKGLLRASGMSPGLGFDPARLVFVLDPAAPPNLTGLDLLARAARAGIDLEMAGWGHIVAVATPADTTVAHERLVAALAGALSEGAGKGGRCVGTCAGAKRELALSLEKECWQAAPVNDLPPSDAYRRPRRWVPVAEAVGRVAADIICPYPPGVPLVVPGQRISEAIAGYLSFLGRSGYPTQGLLTDVSSRVEVIS